MLLRLLTALAAIPPVLAGAAEPLPEWISLDNGEIRLGVKTTSGGAIGWFSSSGEQTNVLNHHDHGRLVQQSYYGREDGTTWAGKPWRWNPVQGGDYKGGAARLLAVEHDEQSLATKSIARHWSGCVDLPDVVFEQTIVLDGPIAHVRFKMTYSGDDDHPPAHQELPAVFVEPEFDTLVLYDGRRPWTGDSLSRSQPGWPNEYRRMSEQWAAYVNAEGFGVGIFVPIANELTCYRFAAGQPSRRGACSYFAPIKTFAIAPKSTFEYDVYLTLGTVEEIRERFAALSARH
jgi:hypothetical protein